jgi:hypothetical protein
MDPKQLAVLARERCVGKILNLLSSHGFSCPTGLTKTGERIDNRNRFDKQIQMTHLTRTRILVNDPDQSNVAQQNALYPSSSQV